MKLTEIIHGLKSQFPRTDGNYEFFLDTTNPNCYWASDSFFSGIEEFKEIESTKGRIKRAILLVRKITDFGHTQYQFCSQAFLTDRPSLLVFAYCGNEPLICLNGNLFSERPGTLFEEHALWAASYNPNRTRIKNLQDPLFDLLSSYGD